ncbi:glutamate 5-kinase [Moraxella catarrhalis]|uniref:glutamate 5-kinase n=1 Tax=Moraxella catarrhalis TaxID=480 RepID=UPI000EA9F2FA|nr:glutamate 5-kinase [Moraxella catarrhalis]AZQ95484.1 putative glutamate 5-kinase [Moraxella catarrhalis]RKL91183.1 glutamate 5-kinase [Moraxella catarrhalis]RUO12218.1 putative glutamate 5-kinase [Moraxella catarrhalis]
MRQEITADIANAFNTDLADAVKDFTAKRVILSDDDWAVNDTQVLSTINYSGRGVFTSFSAHEIDNQTIMQSDVKLICLQDELTEIPQIDDEINEMKIISISHDPAEVSFTIQLRGF